MELCSLPFVWSEAKLSTHTSTRDSWTLIGKSASVSCGVTAPFSWVLVYTRFCLCPPRVCFPSPVQVLWSNHTGLQSQIPQRSQSFCQIPKLGNLLWALELLQQCDNFFGVIVLQFVGCLLSDEMELMATSSNRTYATPGFNSM